MLEEREGILNWLIQGALDWHRNGLRPPQAVKEASRQYQSEQDRVGTFIKERCVMDPDAQTQFTGSTESIYSAYKGWIIENGFTALGSRKLKQEILQPRPKIKEATWHVKEGSQYRKVRGLRGIRLRSDSEECVDSLDDLESSNTESPKPEAGNTAAPPTPAPPAQESPADVSPPDVESAPTPPAEQEAPKKPNSGNGDIKHMNGGAEKHNERADQVNALRREINVDESDAALFVDGGFPTRKSIEDAWTGFENAFGGYVAAEMKEHLQKLDERKRKHGQV
jgi:phage/plasmid-associated DNA primase